MFQMSLFLKCQDYNLCKRQKQMLLRQSLPFVFHFYNKQLRTINFHSKLGKNNLILCLFLEFEVNMYLHILILKNMKYIFQYLYCT